MKMLTAFALVTAGLLSQQQSADQVAVARRRVLEPPGQTQLAQPEVTVAMLGSRTLPLVAATINGKGPFRLLVDTGADVTLLQLKVAEQLGLPVLRPGEQSRLVQVESLDIGRAHFSDLIVGARAWPEEIDGVLGLNTFGKCVLTLDYLRRRVILSLSHLPEPNGLDRLPLKRDAHGLPNVQASFGERPLTLMVDSGAAQGLVVSSDIAASLRFTATPVNGPMLSTFQEGETRAHVGRLSIDLHVGSHSIRTPITFIRDEESPIIGSGLLQYFTITIDQDNKVIQFATNRQTAVPPFRTFGIGARESAGSWIVSDVIPGTVAERIGVTIGDKLMRIDGKHPSMASIHILSATQARLPSSVTVEVERGGTIRMLKIPLTILVP